MLLVGTPPVTFHHRQAKPGGYIRHGGRHGNKPELMPVSFRVEKDSSSSSSDDEEKPEDSFTQAEEAAMQAARSQNSFKRRVAAHSHSSAVFHRAHKAVTGNAANLQYSWCSRHRENKRANTFPPHSSALSTARSSRPDARHPGPRCGANAWHGDRIRAEPAAAAHY